MPFTVIAPRRPATVLTLAALALAFAYLVLGIAAAIEAPRVPYADQWLFYQRMIEQPIGDYALAAENGHREVLPKLVRWVELHHLAANQSLQIGLGIAFALATLVLLVRSIWGTDAALPQRTAAVLAATMGLFWLGNERALAHSNDAIHAYLVTFFLAAGLVLVARESPRESLRACLAALCALAATFSFGSGIAAFPALLGVLAVRRAPARAWWPITLGFALAILLYVGGQVDATTTTVRFDPFAQAVLLLHWLAAPIVYVFWPLLDVDIAAHLPAGIPRDTATAIAQAWGSAFGPIDTSVLPQAIVGGAGVAIFSGLAFAAWRARATSAAARVSLGIAAFALTVGAVIALSRASYFSEHAGQIQAPRYLVWSSLFWSGTLAALVLRLRSPTRATLLSIGLALVLLPSEIWMGRLALSMRSAAEQAAIGGAIGVLDREEPLGETQFEEMKTTLPLLERERAAMYAWPEVIALGYHLPPAQRRDVDSRTLATAAVDNRFDGPGLRVDLTVADKAPRLLVLDANDTVVGLLLHDPLRGRSAWRGWARGNPDAGPFTIAVIDD